MGSCLICGGALSPKATKYCSHKCLAVAFARPPIMCKNSNCGKLFHRRKASQMFCCSTCSNTAGKGRHTEELRARVLELRTQGKSIDDICSATKLTQHAVKAILKRAKMRGAVVGRRSSRPSNAPAVHRRLSERKTEELPPHLQHLLRERLVAGSDPLPPMHHISWGAIAL